MCYLVKKSPGGVETPRRLTVFFVHSAQLAVELLRAAKRGPCGLVLLLTDESPVNVPYEQLVLAALALHSYHIVGSGADSTSPA